MKMVMTVAYYKVVYQNSTEQTDTIILSVVWMHLDFIQKFQATSYTDWCVLLLFLALSSKFGVKFSKYDTTVFLQVLDLLIMHKHVYISSDAVKRLLLNHRSSENSRLIHSFSFGIFLHRWFNNVYCVIGTVTGI